MSLPQFSYDGNVLKTAPSSNYDHRYTSLGQINNIPIAVGNFSRTNGKNVEALEGAKWSVLSDYTFVEGGIWAYSMLNFKDTLYLFGEYNFLTFLFYN